jgi:hypothetical protein
MTILTFAPASVFCPQCDDELGVFFLGPRGKSPIRVSCSRCRRVWELTLPTVTATEVSYTPDIDSLDV